MESEYLVVSKLAVAPGIPVSILLDEDIEGEGR
jgi:hypothetical protein